MSVVAVSWLGICDLCGMAAPEERNSEAEAFQDSQECPCGEGVES